MTTIKTACWFASVPDDHIKIGVSRGTPRGMPAGYRRYPALAPGSWFMSVGPAEYLTRFNAEILGPLDPAAVAAKLAALSGDKVPVMVCYERADKIEAGEQWCHRHLVAQWLEDRLGVTVPEVGFEGRPFDRFALLRKAGIAPPSYRAMAA